MRFLSVAQITREIDQLKKIITVYAQYDLFDMIEDVEKRIVELETLLHEQLERAQYGRRFPAGRTQP